MSSTDSRSSDQPPRLTSRPLFAAAVIAGTVTVWIGSSLIIGNGDASTPGEAERVADIMPRVQIIDSSAEGRSVLVKIQGRTEAWRTVIVRAETGGIIKETPKEKGVVVAPQDILCRIDIRTRRAQQREADALQIQRKLELEAAEELAAAGHRSQVALAAARTAFESAAALLGRINLDIENTEIIAPFGGILEDMHVEIGDLLSPGQPCATVIDIDPMLITAEATEEEARYIKFNGTAQAVLEDGTKVEGKIVYLAATADPRTRTYRVEVEVPNGAHILQREGMTARLGIPSPPVLAHELPAAVLTLNDKGQIGVRVVKEGGIVAFQGGEIVDSAPGKIWLAGPEPNIRLIVVGQEYVAEGTRVEAIYQKEATR